MSDLPVYSRIKVFGERGTGTNFITQMIHANFQVDVLMQPSVSDAPGAAKLKVPGLRPKRPKEIQQYIEDHQHFHGLRTFGGWKHACLTDRLIDTLPGADTTLFICVVRHPALWAKSFHREPFATFLEPDPDLTTFLRHPWVTRFRDEVPELILDSPALLWRLKNQSYLDQADARANVVIVRHEDMLRDHENVLQGFIGHLQRRASSWKVVTSYGRQWAENKRDFWTIRKELPANPFSTLTREQSQLLRDVIGDDLIKRAGYDLPEDE